MEQCPSVFTAFKHCEDIIQSLNSFDKIIRGAYFERAHCLKRIEFKIELKRTHPLYIYKKKTKKTKKNGYVLMENFVENIHSYFRV